MHSALNARSVQRRSRHRVPIRIVSRKASRIHPEVLQRMPTGLTALNAQVEALRGQALASLTTRFAEAELAVQQAHDAGVKLHETVIEVLAFIRQQLDKAPIPS